MKKTIIGLIVLLLCCSAVFSAGSAFEHFYLQGYLTDSNGTPLNGNYNTLFSIYDTAAGGSPLAYGTYALTVTNGAFSFDIFDAISLWVVPDTDILDGRMLYYAFTISGEGIELSPRIPTGSYPYAYTVKCASGESVYVKNAAASGFALYAENTHSSGIAIYARGGAGAGVVGSSEVTYGYGLEGHAHEEGAGLYGQAHSATGFGVMAENQSSYPGALSVIGKIAVDANPAHTYASAGVATIAGAQSFVDVDNANVTANSLILLTMYHNAAESFGGLRVKSITAGNSFRVETTDSTSASAPVTFWYLIIN